MSSSRHGPGVRQIARQVGVAPSTVSRRMKAGRCPWTGLGLAPAPPSPPPAPPPDPEAIRVRAAAGLAPTAISRDLGCTPRQVYRTADRHGIAVRGGGVPTPWQLRAAIENMTAAEALEVALEAFEAAVGQDDAGSDLAASLGLCGRQAQIFCLLHRRAGQIVDPERILGVCSAASDPDRPMSRENLGVQIHKLRRKLAGRYTITNARSQGYILEPT